ncbi:MAG: zinc ribbon domain-containing protein [Microbacterium sp.]
MPTYAYACKSCGHRFDAVQSFTDDALTVCPECGGPLRKDYGSIGVTFKGSGFYRTDSRASGTANTSDSSTQSTKSGAESSGSGSSASSSSEGANAPAASGD